MESLDDKSLFVLYLSFGIWRIHPLSTPGSRTERSKCLNKSTFDVFLSFTKFQSNFLL